MRELRRDGVHLRRVKRFAEPLDEIRDGFRGVGMTALPELTDSELSQLKMLAKAQGWDEIVSDCISEQQMRMPGAGIIE